MAFRPGFPLNAKQLNAQQGHFYLENRGLSPTLRSSPALLPASAMLKETADGKTKASVRPRHLGGRTAGFLSPSRNHCSAFHHLFSLSFLAIQLLPMFLDLLRPAMFFGWTHTSGVVSERMFRFVCLPLSLRRLAHSFIHLLATGMT